MPHSGRAEGIPYSLSRWTDLPAAKWGWFESCLAAKQMVAFDPRSAAPGEWSLAPEDTLGLVFWTKNPTNLVANRGLLAPYNVTVHVTATGWSEVERGAPSLDEAGRLLVETAHAFRKVYWRFSPIPSLPTIDLLHRFRRLLDYAARASLSQVFVAYLQANDRLPETRSPSARFDLLNEMADVAENFGVHVVLCKDDHSFEGWQGAQFLIEPCVQPVDFGGQEHVQLENCGCVLMVDPFTINEACQYDCAYCYAHDQSLSAKKRNTTRSLSVVR